MRARRALLLVVLAVGAAPACSLLLSFDPNGQPCDARGACLAGYQCVANQCVRLGPGSDAGTVDAGDGGADQDAGCSGLACQIAACDAGRSTTVSGTVFDPSGLLPLSGATVYVPGAAVQPFPPTATCEPCDQWVSGQPLTSTVTDARGTFQLTGVPTGAVPLVIQLGRWRRQVQISVQSCQDNPIPPTSGLTRLPRDQQEGDLPRIAVVSGLGDAPECTLLKMGISPIEFTAPDGGGRVHLFRGNGVGLANSPPAAALFDAGTPGLLAYDLVLLPCSAVLTPPPAAEARDLVAYTGLGGRVATTHFASTWISQAPQPFPSTADWHQDAGTPPAPSLVSVQTTFPTGQAFASWLDQLGAADAGMLALSSPRNDVGIVHPPARAWMHGSATGGNVYNWTPYLTFDTPLDAGVAPTCGRVGHFDFHVALPAPSGTFPGYCPPGGYTVDEKAAVFLLLQLGQCQVP